MGMLNETIRAKWGPRTDWCEKLKVGHLTFAFRNTLLFYEDVLIMIPIWMVL